MLSKLDHYVAKHILFSTFIVMLVIVGLMAITLLMEEFEDLNALYNKAAIAKVVLLSLPSMVQQVIPIATLVGVLMGLGVLSSNSELVAIRASGISLFKLLTSILKPVLLLSIMVLFLNQVGIPESLRHVNEIKLLKNSSSKSLNADGNWYKFGNEFVEIDGVSYEDNLVGITRFVFDDSGRLKEYSLSTRADFDQQSNQWVLKDTKLTKLSDDQLVIDHLPEFPWQKDINIDSIIVLMKSPSMLSLSDLYRNSEYLQGQGVNNSEHILLFWTKLFQPLSVVGLVLIGVAFILGSQRHTPAGQRILIGVVVGLAFRFLQELLAPASQVLGFSPLLAALLPIAISFAIALWLLSRVR
jgi:lipopolysaccharide export system permease protein